MSDAMELMRVRHSVRQYLDRPIPEEIRKQLDHYAEELNEAGHLHIQIIYDEPECFNSRMAHYGKFENCRNYIEFIEKQIGFPITMISNGPSRSDIIYRNK